MMSRKLCLFDLFYLSLLTEGFKAQEDEHSDGLEGFFDDFGDTVEVENRCSDRALSASPKRKRRR